MLSAVPEAIGPSLPLPEARNSLATDPGSFVSGFFGAEALGGFF